MTQHAFDRTTGLPVPADQLATYLEALRHYHIHPESKFLNGDYVDRGVTKRRHILALDPFYIGKEANRWEEQFHLGMDDDAQIQYGSASSNRQSAEERVREGLRRFCRRAVAKAGRMSLREVSRAAKDPGGLTPQHLARLDITLARMAAIGRRSL